MASSSDSGEAAAEAVASDNSGKLGHKLLAGVGAAATAAVARKALTSGWKKATGNEPPADPANPDVRWHEAAGWAAASAAVVAVARLVAQRRVAATWRRASGVLPPGMADEQNK
ncbi:MAG TPA: DUF4235 domain-containing protein [Mycobacteriales bacterium]|nr:DUF4235 domain-containing protein [Mycobacteriales bacterium]HWA65456.1 DUF4235 domain-containing protein [Mycobacteriales bacterium]